MSSISSGRSYKSTPAFDRVQKAMKFTKNMQAMKRALKTASRTKTMTEKKSTPQRIAGDGESTSHFKLRKPISSKLGKILANGADWTPSDILNNLGVRLETTTEGLQHYGLIGDYFTDDDINLMFTAQSQTALSTRLFLKSVHAEMMIKNQTNSGARIKIFDVMSKVDTNATTTSPATAWTLGFADAAGGGAAADYTVVGKLPFTNERFKEFFTILNTTNVTLSAGATHTHTVDYAPNRMFSKEHSNAIAGSGIANVTVYTFMVFYGTPINAVDTQAEVTTASISLDVVSMEEYKYSYAHVNTKISDINNTLDVALSSAGAVMADDGEEQAANEA